MNLVAGAVQEAGVDEDEALLHLPDAFFEIQGRAALLVHYPDLQRVPGKAENVLDSGKQTIGECDLACAVHLGFHDVNAAGPAVGNLAGAQVVQRAGRGDYGIENPFEDFGPVGSEYGTVGHVVPDVSHQQEAPAGSTSVPPVLRV